ncbi:MAG: cysteate synthase, partial [Lentimicrobiaceae bacterium]|nr:cysteate synthase [Lentimicrobiaceae bacterium]
MRDVSTDYKLKSFRTKNVFEDTGWLLSEPSVDEPSLIRAIYANKQLNVKDDSYGLYKYSDWLPVRRFLEGSSAPVTFKSEDLANYLGLPNLYIVFSGWFPK